MGIHGHGFLGRVRAQYRMGWVVGSGLMITALLCTSVVDHVRAATSVPTGINRAVPKVSPPAELTFSSPPRDAEFLHTGLFAEPLAPVAATTPEENRDLAQAVLAYRDTTRESGANDAVQPLLTFLAAHPASPWKPALQLNLGMIYRQTGHFSKALEVWQVGWSDAQTLSDPQGRALANAMVARLSQLEAYLGRKETLQPLLDSIHARPVGGTAAQLITDSHTGLHDMVYHPDRWFRCGPLALKRILTYGNAQPSPVALQVLDQAPSTDHGLSLSAVEQIAGRAGMGYQMAYRTAGAPVIVPAVAHWKVGHYAAIVGRSNGGYFVEDTTFGEDIRVSESTLNEEASGYFLVPKGSLPEGWRHVSAAEGATVWGRGGTGNNHDSGATGNACSGSGCTAADVELEVVGLQLHDTPVGYSPSVGPAVRFNLVYSHRDTQQPATFSYTNFGPKWTFTWLSYITDTVNSSKSALLYQRGGGNEPYTFSSTSATAASGPYSQATMTRTVNGSGNSIGFTLTYPDGSFEQFDQAVGSQFFMTAVGDSAGNIVTLAYDAQMRVVAITDAIGQVTTLSYGQTGNPLLVTRITDPFGRSASFTYNAFGQLASITDVLGITSSYAYGQGSDPDFINTLTTPYGSSTFTYGDLTTNPAFATNSTRFIKTVDPLGRTSYIEYDQNIDAGDSSGGVLINSSLIPVGMNICNNNLNVRNTFIFDANEYAQATAGGSLNYSLSHVIHWLHSSDITNTSRFKESEKQPLENRVWYNYPGQGTGGGFTCLESTVSSTGVVINGASNQPSAIGRLLDSGVTQLQTFQYNSSGNVTQATDAVGRQWTYTYAANGIDRLTTTNTTSGSQLLETRTYNGDHLLLTVKGANGKADHFAYDAAGQLTQHTDPLGHITSLTYDSSGHLKTITGPISTAKYTLAYDNVSRVASVTDPAGGTVHYSYDAADRKTQATYPDATTTKWAYTLLDLTSVTDRLSQKTQYTYDADRELITSKDPDNSTTQQGYNLAGKLSSITDANGHTTTFVLDDQGRVTAKQFANGTSLSIAYENGLSRVATVTDALSQTKDYTYNTDNTTATISYSATQATPSVSFTYDSIYPRPTSLTDGVGTTTYSYYPVSSSPSLGANQLQSVSSPIAGTSSTDMVVYSYDALNRIIGTTVNGVAQSVGLDALGRVTSASNPLDTFTYSYSDGTSRVSGVSANSGPTAAMTYFGPTGDELLEQLNVTTHSGGTSLAQFGYTYNADDNVKSLAISSPSTQTTSYTYDTANRLVSGLIGTGSPQYVYGYDHASNLTSITPNGATESFSYTSTNAITSGTYDANGSPTVLSGHSYKWDGENRIVRFASSANNTGSSFTYDGLGRLVRVVDTHGGTITADHSYTWCGNVRCLAHDNTQSGSPVSTQYFDQGAIISGTSYYYVKDELGSVTQLVTSAGTVASQYTHDPYGNQTTVSGTLVSDIGYAGYFYHAVSGLDFTLHRAYDPVHARWLNRDPIGEAGGINLYAYTAGNPISRVDPLGLDDSICIFNPSICGSSSALPVLPASALPTLPQGVVDVGEGVGEGVVLALTLNRVSLQETLELLGLPNGGANTCSSLFQGARAFGAIDAAFASLGSGVLRASQLLAAKSSAQATLLAVQLLTGATDVVESAEGVAPLVNQLQSLEQIAQEALAEKGLIIPRVTPNILRLPPPQ
jgi:RHS repeat-associated protein